MTVATLNAADRAELERLVQLHQVVFEQAPAYRMVDGKRSAVGYDLTLAGTHEPSVAHPLPGCWRCQKVFSDLRRVAEAVFPAPDRASGYGVEPFDHALHESPARGFRNDVELVVEIRHRESYLDPIDDCERRCLADIERELKALGVRERA
jgi:hypothetical protein